MRLITATLVCLAGMSAARANHHFQDLEAACFDRIQGRIAWNYEGDRRWRPENIQRLCQGTHRPGEPGRCFQNVMHGGLDWGGSTRWEWDNVFALCQGTSDANATIDCFTDGLHRRMDWSQAISHCGGRDWRPEIRPASCQQQVQGQVAWNYEGNRIWTAPYLNRLCHGSRYPGEPGRCYELVMHGGINWGGGTRWEPDNVLNLCAGTDDADYTIGCFEQAIHNGHRWDVAIARCGR